MMFRQFPTSAKFCRTRNISVVDSSRLTSDARASTTWPAPMSQSLDEFHLNVMSSWPTEYSLHAYLF